MAAGQHGMSSPKIVVLGEFDFAFLHHFMLLFGSLRLIHYTIFNISESFFRNNMPIRNLIIPRILWISRKHYVQASQKNAANLPNWLYQNVQSRNQDTSLNSI